MKKILLLTLFAFTFCNINLAQNISVNHEQTVSACDGSVILDESSINTGYPYTWWQCSAVDSSLQINSGGNIDSVYNLCPALYSLEYHDSLYMISNFDTLYYYFTVNPANICSNFAVSAAGVNETSSGSCDGSASASVSGANGAVTYLWSNSSTTASINGLCAGNYTITATDTASCTANFTVNIASDSVPTGTLSAYVVTSQESTGGACDGSGAVVVTGGVGPYSYLHSSGGNSYSDSLLCSGIYNVLVTDSQLDSLNITYIISSPITTFNTYSYVDSTIIDTILSTPIENCIVDYSTIDTAFISNVIIYGIDSILVTWTVSSSSGFTNINQYYQLPSTNGVYSFVLDIFCTQKATDNIFTIVDNYYFNLSLLSIDENYLIDNDQLTIYPNPTKGKISVALEGDFDYTLIDSRGRILMSGHGKDKVTCDIISFESGVYFVTINNQNGSITQRAFKQ